MSFIKIRDIEVSGNMFLGSIIRIQVILDNSADSMNITIEDPYGTDKVDKVNVTPVANSSNRVWEYIYTSNEADNAGEYQAIIRATKGSDTLLSSYTFFLQDADDD